MSKRHRMGRNVRGGVVVGAVLAAAALTTGAAYSSASASPATMLNCAEAQSAYRDAAADQGGAKNHLNATNTELDDATKALADARAADAAEDNTTPDVPGKLDDADKAKSAAETRAFRAGEAQSSAQHIYTDDTAATAVAKTTRDTACQGPAGPAGVTGAVGPKGIDARIVLARTVCARAVVTPNPERLVRVVTLIPCPATVPAPPAAEPRPGDEVVVIPPAAPVPPVTETHLPVTH